MGNSEKIPMKREEDIIKALQSLKELRNSMKDNSDNYSHEIETVIETIEWVLNDQQDLKVSVRADLTI